MQRKIHIGEIVERSKRLEAKLKTMNAEGRGLHEQTTSIQDKLGDELSKYLRFIATVRNKAVHEPDFDVAANIEDFNARCDDVETALQALAPGKTKKSRKPRTRKKPGKDSQGQNFNYLNLLPFIPGLNIIYFIFLLILSLACGSAPMVMLMLYVAAFSEIIQGILHWNKEQLCIGIGIFTVTYICNMLVKSRRIPQLRFIPVLNILTILEQLRDKIRWKLFFIAMLLLTATVISGFMVFAWNQTFPGLIIYAAAYLGGIVFFIHAGIAKNSCKIN
jgi:hypothetical protein